MPWLAWIFAPASLVTGAACGIAGVLHLIRLARWRGYRTAAEPLVTILHVGYLFVPVGFLLMALAIAFPGVVAPVAAVHAWTAGRHRRHDARRDDAREPRPYRA